MKTKIESITKDNLDECIELIRNVYDEFVSKDYSDEGNSTFYKFIEKEAMTERLIKGNSMICVKMNNKIVGVQEIRDKNHIALFFVNKKYQNIGIGRKLFEFGKEIIKKLYSEINEITVNSSPFAEKIYKKLGFISISGLEEKNGIKFIQMKYHL